MGSAKLIAIGLGLAMAWPALAEDWQVLDGAGINAALTARVLGYDPATQQDFKADGTTLYHAGGKDSAGRWEVRGDQYCSVWPPSDHWACYDVAVAGNKVKFVAEDGSETVGGYIDLN